METLHITTAADLISLIGRSLGYWPHESLVCISLQTNRIGATLRLDLPSSAEHAKIYARSVAGHLGTDADATATAPEQRIEAKEFGRNSVQVMSSPQPHGMNRCRTDHGQPSKPERSPDDSTSQQPEGPSARDLTPLPTQLHRPPWRLGTSRDKRQRDPARSMCTR